ELVKRHILCIQALNRYKSTKLRRAIIADADAELICVLAECGTETTLGQVQNETSRVGTKRCADDQETSNLAWR
ncbi:MAG: hypothetical protein M3H12_04760, partial [Chromatiales bacterium]